MTASQSTPQHATGAIEAPFNSELFERRCAERGANTEKERAALVGVDPSTLHRFRKGEIGPRLEVARRFAAQLGVSVDDLWPAGTR